MIFAAGFSFYAVSAKMIDRIYASSLSSDQKLLNAIGISSFSSLSKDEIQRRIDNQIERYSTLLNSKARTLSYMKDTLQNVNDFHFTFYSIQNVLKKMKGQVSISQLEYSTKSASRLEMEQFSLEKSGAFKEEEKYFKELGLDLQEVKNGTSKWYKTVNVKFYLRSKR
ncbi:hypothetical protein [Mesoaciditoga sp.]